MRSRLPVAILVGITMITIAVTTSAAPKPTKSRISDTPFFVSKDTPEDLRNHARWEREAAIESRRYRGLAVTPPDPVTGATLELQRRIGDLLTEQDFVPHGRVEHFQWFFDMLPKSGHKHTGWDGTIVETRLAPGGVLVKLEVRPANSWAIQLGDHVFEYDLYTNDHLEYLKSVDGHYPNGRYCTCIN